MKIMAAAIAASAMKIGAMDAVQLQKGPKLRTKLPNLPMLTGISAGQLALLVKSTGVKLMGTLLRGMSSGEPTSPGFWHPMESGFFSHSDLGSSGVSVWVCELPSGLTVVVLFVHVKLLVL